MKLIYTEKLEKPIEKITETSWRILYNPEYVENEYPGSEEGEVMHDNYWLYDVVLYEGSEITYPGLVQVLVARKYDIYSELAINRQKDTKPEDWNTYNTYCEDCKTLAKQLMEEIYG